REQSETAVVDLRQSLQHLPPQPGGAAERAQFQRHQRFVTQHDGHLHSDVPAWYPSGCRRQQMKLGFFAQNGRVVFWEIFPNNMAGGRPSPAEPIDGGGNRPCASRKTATSAIGS